MDIKTLPDGYLAKCTMEILEWRKTGTLPEGTLRECHKEMEKKYEGIDLRVTESEVLLEIARRRMEAFYAERIDCPRCGGDDDAILDDPVCTFCDGGGTVPRSDMDPDFFLDV